MGIKIGPLNINPELWPGEVFIPNFDNNNCDNKLKGKKMNKTNTNQAVKQLIDYKKEMKVETKNIYSIFDDAVGFTDVFVQPNDAIAFRMFETMANNPQSPINKYAKAMTLCKIGELNVITGEIEKDVRKIVNANEILETNRAAEEAKKQHEQRQN